MNMLLGGLRVGSGSAAGATAPQYSTGTLSSTTMLLQLQAARACRFFRLNPAWYTMGGSSA